LGVKETIFVELTEATNHTDKSVK